MQISMIHRHILNIQSASIISKKIFYVHVSVQRKRKERCVNVIYNAYINVKIFVFVFLKI